EGNLGLVQPLLGPGEARGARVDRLQAGDAGARLLQAPLRQGGLDRRDRPRALLGLPSGALDLGQEVDLLRFRELAGAALADAAGGGAAIYRDLAGLHGVE